MEEIRTSKGKWSNNKADIGSQITQHGTGISKKVLTNHVTPIVKHVPTVMGSPARSPLPNRPASPSRPMMSQGTPHHTSGSPGMNRMSPQHASLPARPSSPTKMPAMSGGVHKVAPMTKMSPESIKKGLDHVGASHVSPKSPVKQQKP
jgi:hypothetical protein